MGGENKLYFFILHCLCNAMFPFSSFLTPLLHPFLQMIHRYWQTANFYPGHVAPPQDTTAVYSVDINATMPAYWGIKGCFDHTPLIRPTGIYLPPGGIATVTVPSALVQKGYQIQVGASELDNFNKDEHRRMDRITSTYEIKSSTTYVANPLGGGLYIKVPYLSSDGIQSISISGAVIKAPFFCK
jgi:hypothetical protein